MGVFFQWVRDNPILAQALASLVLAGLTTVLVIANSFFVWISFRTIRIMQKDLEHRTRPILELNLILENEIPPATATLAAYVTAQEASAELLEMTAKCAYRRVGHDELEKKNIVFSVAGYTIRTGRTAAYRAYIPASNIGKLVWIATIRYTDAVHFRKYKQSFFSEFGELPAFKEAGGVKERLRRLFFWKRRRSV